MNIHQLSVVFDDRQDRLLMRVNTQEGEEVRLWLTRSISLRLLGPMESTIAKLEARNPAVAADDARARGMLVELKHQAFLQNADLATPFSGQSTSLPLGDIPLLVTEVRLDVRAQGGAQWYFRTVATRRPLPGRAPSRCNRPWLMVYCICCKKP